MWKKREVGEIVRKHGFGRGEKRQGIAYNCKELGVDERQKRKEH